MVHPATPRLSLDLSRVNLRHQHSHGPVGMKWRVNEVGLKWRVNEGPSVEMFIVTGVCLLARRRAWLRV